MLRLALLSLLPWWPIDARAEHPCREGELAQPGAERMWRGIETDRPVPPGAVAYGNSRDPDRYGRVRVHVFLGERHVQEDLLREGRARAHPIRETEACAARLLEAEREARRERRGIWRTRTVERAADPTLADRAGRFAIVEGVVRSVGARRRTIYLNFGPRWTTDFTVAVARRDIRDEDFEKVLEGASARRVRVRGHLEVRGGAMIRVHDKAQIEWLNATQ